MAKPLAAHPAHQLSCYEVATGKVLWHCNVQEKHNEISELTGLSNSNKPDIVQLKSDQELGRSPRRNSASVGQHCERQDDP